MGLRHRTTISVLREQRRSADLQAEASQPASSLGRESPSRRALEPQQALSEPPGTGLLSEKDLTLLTRLRGRISAPLDTKQNTQTECRSLEDELKRLSQLKKRERGTDPAVLPPDLIIPQYLYATPDQDDLPFRTLKIVAPVPGQRPLLQRLDSSLSDLSYYQKLEQELVRHEQTKTLTLVTSQSPTVEDRQNTETEMPKDPKSEAELSEEAAVFMQKMLKTSEVGQEPARLPQNLVLSLLDT